MTRFLSESLKAEEPFFRLGLQNMEAAHGNPNSDIRLSAQVSRDARQKLCELGLDPEDTTPEELYHFLQERIKNDDKRLTKRLRYISASRVSAEGKVVPGMVYALKHLPGSRCFALKNSSLRSILRQLPPKKAMKQLGYRSMDSFLKHEAPLSVMAAAWLSEGASWQKRLLERYKGLGPGDFESRDISIISPDSSRWRRLAEITVSGRQHNILCFKELGALFILPLPDSVPAGVVTASLTFALHELNQIRASSTFLKLCQVRPDFGDLVRQVAYDDPKLAVSLLDQPVSWQLLQRYYAGLKDQLHDTLFEPHVRAEDMVWEPVERALSAIDPDFEFWNGSSYLGVLHQKRPVSLNVADVALNCCNKLPFGQRTSRYFRQSLWQELLLGYLEHDAVEQSVASMLQPELAKETVTA